MDSFVLAPIWSRYDPRSLSRRDLLLLSAGFVLPILGCGGGNSGGAGAGSQSAVSIQGRTNLGRSATSVVSAFDVVPTDKNGSFAISVSSTTPLAIVAIDAAGEPI